MTPTLIREVFTTSRELEYFSESELVTQTGYDKEDWFPRVLVKELVDNSLDDSEKAGIAPEIMVSLTTGELVVEDNGSGLPSDVLKRILDFSSRTSDKAVYVSPTRGAQGNALKTVLAIPYVLNEGSPATVVIGAQGLRHQITISTDHVARRPVVDHSTRETVKKPGTAIRIKRNSASSKEDCVLLKQLLSDYSLFNPHVHFALRLDGVEHKFPATTATFRKWIPSDPTSAYWYGVEQLEDLVASYIQTESTSGRSRTVREFISEFRGLSGSVKRQQVVSQAGLDRAYLHDLLSKNRKLNRSALQDLLDAMQQASTPVKPETLGILGEEHFRQRLSIPGNDQSFRYKRLTGCTEQGLPYAIECAFAMTEDPLFQGAHIGLNWSPPLSNPLQENRFETGENIVWGFSAVLAENRLSMNRDPVSLALHLICPRFNFLDRGKGSVSLCTTFASAVAKAVLATTKEWAAIKKKQERDQRQADRMRERYWSGTSTRVTVKDAAYQAMPAAYAKASGNGKYPANTRQIMYAARPEIQEETDKALNDVYFNQVLLPDFVREHPEETAEWDVVYDARGHLSEPHTAHEVPLGTIRVREYLSAMEEPPNGSVHLPEIPTAFPTIGPKNRYSAILYVEKEGFLPLLQKAEFGERYDLAIMSSKGMGTTAVRTLIEAMFTKVTVLVLHDFDKSGFSILGTLMRDTRRYEYASEIQVTDLGLRLEDVEKWHLGSEDVAHTSDPTDNLELNGATDAEIKFLRGQPQPGYPSGRFHGHRVELNAFTSDQFVAWLEAKLKHHRIRKVIPDTDTLKQAYLRAAAINKHQAISRAAMPKVEEYVASLKVPKTLAARLKDQLARNPSLSWDQALERLVKP